MNDVEQDAGQAAVEQLLKTAAAKLEHGEVSYGDLVKMVAPAPPAVEVPSVLPLPAQITESAKAALAKLPEVFGAVVPAERRVLLPSEATSLMVEREVLFTIETMAKDRKDDIRTTILNHNDVKFEETATDGVKKEATRDKDGHWIVAGEARGEPGTEKRFAVEPRKGSVGVDPKMIEALANDPEVDWIDHADYLDMTEQTRVFSEPKMMLLLKKKPHLVRALREAIVPSTAPSVAVNPRKA